MIGRGSRGTRPRFARRSQLGRLAEPPGGPLRGLLVAAALACGGLGCKQANQSPTEKQPVTAEPTPPTNTDDQPAASADTAETAPLVAERLPPPPPLPPVPRGLPALPLSDGHLVTAAKVETGQRLFVDPVLSANRTRSCASCHQERHGFASGEARDTTATGVPNLRHTPSLWNVGYLREWTWDGSMVELESQILTHIRGQLDADLTAVVDRVARVPGYAARFQRAFGTPSEHDTSTVSQERLAAALAAYVRTLRSGGSPWDRYEAGDRDAVSQDAIAGARLFTHSLGCATCHPPPLYTDGGYHDRGIDRTRLDPGRARATGDVRDEGLFRTAPLRGLVYTAPYFHDGSKPTLEDAVAHELATSGHDLDPLPLQQLLAFLRALSPPLPQAP